MNNPLAILWQRWKARRSDAAVPITQSLTATWLPKEDARNPFTVPGYDCLTAARLMGSGTTDPAITEKFIALRSASGEFHRGKLPDDAIEAQTKLEYEYSGEIVDGLLFRAAAMEEKWDIFLYDSRIYFCRSWTGKLTFVAQLKPSKGSITLTRIWAAGSEDSTIAVQQVDYIIKSHLYSQRVPHPLPASLENDGAAVALYSFEQYGRLCCFGTYKNTVRDQVYKPSALQAARKPEGKAPKGSKK
jgi:hypothetical protein